MERVPKTPVIDALQRVWHETALLLNGLDDADWSVATDLPGWDVQAVVAHIIGTEAMLVGEPAPASDTNPSELPHVRNDVAAFNELWVQALADAAPEEMRQRFRDLTEARLAALAAMPESEWDAEGFTPVGPDTYGRFMRVRVFDCWLHEHDIRAALGMGDRIDEAAMAFALDELTLSMGYAIGKRAGAPDGAVVTIELTGPAARRMVIVVEGGRARVVDPAAGSESAGTRPAGPEARLTMPVMVFARLAGGRITLDDVTDEVDLGGDSAFARRVAEHLAVTL